MSVQENLDAVIGLHAVQEGDNHDAARKQLLKQGVHVLQRDHLNAVFECHGEPPRLSWRPVGLSQAAVAA